MHERTNRTVLGGYDTAIHEAAHAVIGRVLNLSCGSAMIIQNPAEEEAGHAMIGDPMRTASNWERAVEEAFEDPTSQAPKLRNLYSAFRGTIIARMAGAEAELVILGACRGGDGDDRREIAWMADSRYTELSEKQWERYEPRMRRQTQRLVRKHRATIERVAEALLQHGELPGTAIDALVAEGGPKK